MMGIVQVLAAAVVLITQGSHVGAVACAVQGVVVFEEDGTPIPFTNVVALGTQAGAMTDENGLFRLCDLAPGTHAIRAFVIGYRAMDRDVTVAAGMTAHIEFALKHSGMSPEGAAAESVGVDVSSASSDFDLSVVPTFDELRVGEPAEFEITLRNNGTESVLVGDLTGQPAFIRCPIQTLEITGPPGGAQPALQCATGCGGPRLVTLEAGSALVSRVPYQGTCREPGTYRAKFRYTSTSGDVRDWICLSEQAVGRWLSGSIRRAAMVDLADSVEFVVKE